MQSILDKYIFVCFENENQRKARWSTACRCRLSVVRSSSAYYTRTDWGAFDKIIDQDPITGRPWSKLIMTTGNVLWVSEAPWWPTWNLSDVNNDAIITARDSILPSTESNSQGLLSWKTSSSGQIILCNFLLGSTLPRDTSIMIFMPYFSFVVLHETTARCLPDI